MTIVTSLSERRQKKRWKFERIVLRKLSLSEVERSLRTYFQPLLAFEFFLNVTMIERGLDLAVEAYLLGAEYSRFAYFGEEESQVLKRCNEEMTNLYEQLEDSFLLWLNDENERATYEIVVAQFIYYWWKKGYEEGDKSYRLRLR